MQVKVALLGIMCPPQSCRKDIIVFASCVSAHAVACVSKGDSQSGKLRLMSRIPSIHVDLIVMTIASVSIVTFVVKVIALVAMTTSVTTIFNIGIDAAVTSVTTQTTHQCIAW